MDLVAPTGNVGGSGDVVTIDRMGVNGYTTGNYTSTFGGTSAAAPQVAGVAALLVSVNPNLTESQITFRLKNTATDMGPIGFDTTFGYGRLNTEKAVRQSLPVISGQDNFCGVSSLTLTSPSVLGFQYNWSVDIKLQIISGQNTNTIVVQPKPGYSGIGNVSLTIIGNCGNLSLTKALQITPVITNFRYIGNNPGNPMTGELLQAEVEPVPDAFFYEWYSDSNFLETTTDPFISTYDWECGDHRLYVRASTPCGYTALNGPDNYYWGMCLYAYTYSPNPASSEIIIENSTIKEKRGQVAMLQTSSVNKINIVVYDFNGRRVKTEEFNSNEASHRLDVSDLKVGHYFLKINNGIREETHQIIIAR